MVIANLPNIVTDTWVNVSWDEFMEFVDHPDFRVALNQRKKF